MPSPPINQELSPYLRDVHDDHKIILEIIAADRDRLAGALDIYLSSIANRNAEATKTLTLLGTAALPGLVIASIFGMNIMSRWYLGRKDCLPGGTTSASTNN